MTAIAVDTISELIRFHRDFEPWNGECLTHDELEKYFSYMLDHDRIICLWGQASLIGYVESWQVDQFQLEKIITNSFDRFKENITDGPICYISNVTIDPRYRGLGVINRLKEMLFTMTPQTVITFCGRRNGKVHKPLIFTKKVR